MSHPLSSKDTLASAVERAAVPRSARLLVAVSGGPDSVALLHTLVAVSGRHKWQVRVGHVNHGLRGEESDEDERFVLHLANELGLAVNRVRVDTRRHATLHGLSPEEAARELRYHALSSWAECWAADRVVTGHTLDDQTETVLLRLVRGSGLRGLAAMSPDTGRIWRPFLNVAHRDVMRFLIEAEYPFRLDSSNADIRLRRNAVRMTVVPALTAIEPRAVERIAATAAHLRLDDDFHRLETRRALARLRVDCDEDSEAILLAAWRELHPALRRATIRGLLDELVPNGLRHFDSHHIATLEGSLVQGVPIEGRLPGRLQVTVEGELARFGVGTVKSVPQPPPVELPIPGTAEFGGFRISAEVGPSSIPLGDLLAVCGPWHALLDMARLGRHVTVRGWSPGDRMCPVGLEGSRKLQDLFVDRKVPRALRHILLAVERGGELVWVAGIAVDRGFAATPETERLAHLIVKPPPNLHGTI